MIDKSNLNLVTLTVDITSAYLSRNAVATSELLAMIESVHAALEKAGEPALPEAPTLEPAVPVRVSIKPDYLICLEDGKKVKMLKRYLNTRYNLTPQEYRARWGLPSDYPMVAPSYAARRAELARASGLGRKATTVTEQQADSENMSALLSSQGDGADTNDVADSDTASLEQEVGSIPVADPINP